MVSQDYEKAIAYADILNCATGEWPIKLGCASDQQ
jgi:hypothetical protein